MHTFISKKQIEDDLREKGRATYDLSDGDTAYNPESTARIQIYSPCTLVYGKDHNGRLRLLEA